MSKNKLWSVGRGPGSLRYAVFDGLRHWLNRRLADYLRSRLPEGARPARILEAGSGPGSCSAVLAAQPGVGLCVALDHDATAFAVAPKNATDQNVVGDLYHLPFGNGQFDMVFNSSTMEHLPSFGQALREMARVTQDGGRIFVGVPYKFGPFFIFNFLSWHNQSRIWVGRLFSSWDLCDACEKEGLEPAEIRFYFFRCFVGVTLVKPK